MLIRLVFTEIQPFENVKIYKEMYGNLGAVRHVNRLFFQHLDTIYDEDEVLLALAEQVSFAITNYALLSEGHFSAVNKF